MTEDIHKVDRPVFDRIRIQPNHENSGSPQKRRGQSNRNQPLNGLLEDRTSEGATREPNDSENRLLDIQV